MLKYFKSPEKDRGALKKDVLETPRQRVRYERVSWKEDVEKEVDDIVSYGQELRLQDRSLLLPSA